MLRTNETYASIAQTCEPACARGVGAGSPRPRLLRAHAVPGRGNPAPTDTHPPIPRGRRAFRLVVIAAVALLMTGCMRSRQLENLCDEIADQYPGTHFSREISLSLGPISMGLVRFATGFSDDAREAREYLSGVSRVQLAIYEVSSAPRSERLKLPKQLHELLEEDGWEIVVKSSEKDGAAWILFREDDGVIRDMHITSLDNHELVMIRVSGCLNELFDKAIKDHGTLTEMVLSKTIGKKDADSTDSGD